MNTKKYTQQGQALITLLFVTIVGVTLITAASFVTLGNVSSTSAAEQGTVAYYNAESGVEDALLLMLRYPKGSVSPTPYTGGTIPYANGGTATITVDLNTGIITSTGTFGSAKREIQAQTTNGANGLQVSSWQEVTQ